MYYVDIANLTVYEKQQAIYENVEYKKSKEKRPRSRKNTAPMYKVTKIEFRHVKERILVLQAK